MALPHWCYHGITSGVTMVLIMVLPWCYHIGVTMVLPWCYHIGVTMVLPWCYHIGVTMVLLMVLPH